MLAHTLGSLSQFPADTRLEPEAHRALIGCKNMGGSCSADAVVQALRHCPYMQQLLSKPDDFDAAGEPLYYKNSLIDALLRIVNQETGIISPAFFTKIHKSEAGNFIMRIADGDAHWDTRSTIDCINRTQILLPVLTWFNLTQAVETAPSRELARPTAPAFAVTTAGLCRPTNLQETVTINMVTYNLTGMVVHTGGHFVTYVKQENCDGNWHQLNDTHAVRHFAIFGAALRDINPEHRLDVLLYSKRP